MRASGLRLAVPLLGGLLLAGCVSCEKSREVKPEATADPARLRLQSFWEAYGEATKQRTQGDVTRALELYRRALEYQPGHEDSTYYLGSCLAELGRYEEAVQTYEQLVARNPSSHRGHFQIGSTLSTPLPGAIIDFARARAAFMRNIEINREESGPFLRLGELALYENKTGEARKHFDTAAGFQSPEGIFRAGFVRFVAGDLREASSRFERVLDINAHERKISGRGVHSEGDIRSSQDRLTPMEAAGVQSLLYLYWSSVRLHGYPKTVPPESRILPPRRQGGSIRFLSVGRTGSGAAGPVGSRIDSLRDLWTADWTRQPPDRAVARSLSIDLDGDGVRERVEAGVPPEALRIVYADGRRTIVGDISRYVVDLAISDFDGNGAPDIIALVWKEGVRFFRNEGGGRFEDRTRDSGLPSDTVERYALTSMDYDGDGRSDLVVSEFSPYERVLLNLARPNAIVSSPSLRLFRNLDGRRFEEVREMPGLQLAHSIVRLLAADFDGDGFEDLLLACGGLDIFRYEPSLILRNMQGRSFEPVAYLPSFGTPLRAIGAEITDLDKDGRPDVVLRTAEGTLSFRNAGFDSR